MQLRGIANSAPYKGARSVVAAAICAFVCALTLAAVSLAAPQQAFAADSDGTFAAGSTSYFTQDTTFTTQASGDTVQMLRLYNKYTGEHLYTADPAERDKLKKKGWKYEGVGWTAPATSSTPVYRLYNKYSGDHHYTMSSKERDKLVKLGWKDEGIGWYSPDSGQPRVALYREFNPYESIGTHNYTLDGKEHNKIVKLGWKAEGAAWYAIPSSAQLANGWIEYNGTWQYRSGGTPLSNRWYVTKICPPIAKCYPGLQRYWFGTDACLARNRFVDPSNAVDAGAGYMSFATSGGNVVVGKYDAGNGRVYLGDSDGRLELASGWITTKKYDGKKQTYYMDGTLHAAITGVFTVSGKKYYGIPGEGYIAKSQLVGENNKYYVADKNGVLTADKVANRLISKAQQYSSPSQYLIMIDIDNPRLVVLEGKKGAWKTKFVWDCDTGKPSTPTIEGVFQLGIKGYSFGESHGYSCYWYSQISGDYLIHTRLYVANTHILLDGAIGQRCSDGCVRSYDENVKWIWDNVPSGTTIVTMY